MNKIDSITVVQTVLIFVMSYLLLNLLRDKPPKKVKKKNIYTTFETKTAIAMIVASVGLTVLLSRFTSSYITLGALLYTFMSIAPYVLINNANRIQQEKILEDIILYCQNCSLLLKQTNNVYQSLTTVKDDLHTELAKDLQILIDNFQEGEKAVREIMDQIEQKYPYTCLKQLHIIILYMNYENSRISPALIDTFQDDVAILEEDIRNNATTRKSMRIQYIGITLASIFIYFMFCSQIRVNMESIFQSMSFQIIQTLYLFANVVCLFMVDRYFNMHISVE